MGSSEECSSCSDSYEISVGKCSDNAIFENFFAAVLPPLWTDSDAKEMTMKGIRDLFQFSVQNMNSETPDGLSTALIDTPPNAPDGDEFLKMYSELVKNVGDVKELQKNCESCSEEDDDIKAIPMLDRSVAEAAALTLPVTESAPASAHTLVERIRSLMTLETPEMMTVRAALTKSPLLVFGGFAGDSSIPLDILLESGIPLYTDEEKIKNTTVIFVAMLEKNMQESDEEKQENKAAYTGLLFPTKENTKIEDVATRFWWEDNTQICAKVFEASQAVVSFPLPQNHRFGASSHMLCMILPGTTFSGLQN